MSMKETDFRIEILKEKPGEDGVPAREQEIRRESCDPDSIPTELQYLPGETIRGIVHYKNRVETETKGKILQKFGPLFHCCEKNFVFYPVTNVKCPIIS